VNVSRHALLASPSASPDLAAELGSTPAHVLREYALLADGERGALIGPRGDIAWLCFPGWDGDPLFAALLGAPSVYEVSPVGRAVWGGWYEDGTLIWHSRWACGGSLVECREALAFPGDPDRLMLLRRIEAVRGPARLRVLLDLRSDWGRTAVPWRRDGQAWTARGAGWQARWTGAAAAAPRDGAGGLRMELALEPGDHHDLALEISGSPIDGAPPAAARLWKATAAAWCDAVPPLRAAAQRDARHAVAVLRGLSTQRGGMVACATTSLPERATEGRDYDYRYVWVRDQCYAGEAAALAGVPSLLDRAVRFCSERLLDDGPDLRPLYRSGGLRVPQDGEIDLPGYPGAPDVHCGNRATEQFQLDSLGETLLLFAAAAGADREDGGVGRAARIAVDAIAARWQEPESGLWELPPRSWTHSWLICAAGLRGIAASGLMRDEAERCLSLATALTGEALSRCVHPSGRWQRAPDDARVDASLLLPAVRGALPASDPRVEQTIAAVRRDLSSDGYVYRFRPDDGPLGTTEGAFLLCGFWMSLAELQQGRIVEAVRWFERNRAACGPPGLYSEEYDVQQRQLRGNLPQAFVHALMLECAARLADSGEDER
jgi:GH15 family glucan-1,4-alpha-glucosidase